MAIFFVRALLLFILVKDPAASRTLFEIAPWLLLRESGASVTFFPVGSLGSDQIACFAIAWPLDLKRLRIFACNSLATELCGACGITQMAAKTGGLYIRGSEERNRRKSHDTNTRHDLSPILIAFLKKRP
jgi:hypothetical protein